jgi:outer membrane protein assembly factor BamB
MRVIMLSVPFSPPYANQRSNGFVASIPARSVRRVAASAATTILLAGCGSHRAGVWPLPNGNLAGTRLAARSGIDAGNVGRLRASWRFGFTTKRSFSGIFASTPVVGEDTVYVQDLGSNVFALDRSTGALRWARRYGARNDGPNGLALVDGRVYGATDSEAFAVDSATGRELWRRHLTSRSEQFVDIAPVAWQGLVFLSTVGYPPAGRGAIYALDAATGSVRWKFDTIEHPWRYPLKAGGGGLWYPVSLDAQGRLYGGNSNPAPWGGTPELPNGGAFPGPARYTDSLLVLAARTGRLLWHDQVTPHDIRDYDFAATPLVAGSRVIGAGKSGLVIAWDRETHRRLWTARIGLHRNDVGPLPGRTVTVCPGLLGGVETPMAYADGRVFVPAVDLCVPASAVTAQALDAVDPSRGTGLLVALDATSGKALWTRRFRSPNFGCATVANDVVFTATFDGTVYGLSARDGRVLWRAKLRAGTNSCPAVAGDQLFVGAGVPRPGSVEELVAFGPS